MPFVVALSHKNAPAHKKQIPNVPHDIPVPHTLVLDLENTLVTSTWHRKHGWRHAKRPGVDKFLHDMAQYYEIVLYSPSIDGIAHPVVEALDKDGCIMHRLYRDATYYHNGVHVKDLKSLNRNVKRMIVLDDDPDEVQFNPENLVRVKPYVDPNDREDNTLERITPFLIEIARENYEDIPTLLSQYQGMDADEIADEQERRWVELERSRRAEASHGLGRWARAGAVHMPAPELPPPHHDRYRSSNNKQLTAKDIAGAAPPSSTGSTLADGGDGLMGFLNRRAKEKEEHQMRKMESWQKAMMKKQKEREMQQQQQQ
jgi:mitochondrial import inner membrane translocase subunit TIM50